MVYLVKWDNVIVGIYSILENGTVKYKVNKKNVDKLLKMGIKIAPLLVNDYIGCSFPYLDNRIKNSSRFQDSVIGYHTDPIELIEYNK